MLVGGCTRTVEIIEVRGSLKCVNTYLLVLLYLRAVLV